MSSFSLDGEDYYVEYEGLYWLCTSCGVYGHKVENCKIRDGLTKTGNKVENNLEMEKTRDMDVEDEKRNDNEVWRMVQKANRQRRGGKDKKYGNLRQLNKGYQFGVYAEEEEEEGEVEKAVRVEAKVVSDGVGAAGVVGEQRSLSVVRFGKDKKGGVNKKQTKIKSIPREEFTELNGRQELRKEKHTRGSMQKVERRQEVLCITYEKSKMGGDKEEIVAGQNTKALGPQGVENVELDGEVGSNLWVSGLQLDPDNTGQVCGPSSRFWVDSSIIDHDYEMVEETLCERMIEGNGPKSPMRL